MGLGLEAARWLHPPARLHAGGDPGATAGGARGPFSWCAC